MSDRIAETCNRKSGPVKVSLITACHNGAVARKTAMKLLAGAVVPVAGGSGEKVKVKVKRGRRIGEGW